MWRGSSARTEMHYLSHLARLGAADLHPSGRKGTERLERELMLRSGMRVLEIGCGTGQTMVRFATSSQAWLDGVDLLPEMLAVARLRLALGGLRRRTTLVQADAAAGLPFGDSCYDRVYAESVVGFQPPHEARRLLAEVFRVLVPGGLFIANEAVWREGTTPATVAAIHESCLADFGLAQACKQGWTLADWLAAMRDAGFLVVASHPLGGDGPARRAAVHPSLAAAFARARSTAGSGALTMLYRATAWFSPSVRRATREYRKRVRRHHGDGRHIEAYLFVLEKADGSVGRD